MKYSREFIDRVRDASNIVEIVSRQTQLKRSGGNQFTGLCPFPDHKEKTPSFSVSESKQVYYCFGCKKSGNVFTFVESIMGLNFPETVEWLANQAGIDISEAESVDQNKDTKFKNEKNELFKINQQALDFFKKNTKSSAQWSQIFNNFKKNRGLSNEVCELFQLGIAPKEWSKLSDYFQANSINFSDAEGLGLVKPRQKGGSGHYDVFRDRVMFPIFDLKGSVVGFGGRSVGPELPKYLNSPESIVFKKGKVLYGLWETSKYIRSHDQVIVVEGYMDLLALYQAGVKNVVAPLGTALTKDHVKILSRYTKNVLVLFDGDSAGINAAERSLPILLDEGLLPKGCNLPDKVDPDDFIKKYGEGSFKNLLNKSQDLFMIFLNRKLQDFSHGATEKVALMEVLSPVLLCVKDRRLQELYLDEVALRLQVEKSWVENSLRNFKQSHSELDKQEQKPEENKKYIPHHELKDETQFLDEKKIQLSGKRPKAEDQIVTLALSRPEILKEVMKDQIYKKFTHLGLRMVIETAAQFGGQTNGDFDKLTSLLINRVDLPEVLFLFMEEHIASLKADEAIRLYKDCHQKVEDAHLRFKSRQLSLLMRGKSTSEQLGKLEQIMNIQRTRRVPKNQKDPE